SAQFAIASFARQAAAISLGQQSPNLQTGNLDARRDLSDVRDVVAAYIELMEKGRSGEAYNIGSGVAVAMKDIVGDLCSLVSRPITVTMKESLLRPNDPAATLADASKLRRETGWAPRYSLRQSLTAIFEYWRQVLQTTSSERPPQS